MSHIASVSYDMHGIHLDNATKENCSSSFKSVNNTWLVAPLVSSRLLLHMCSPHVRCFRWSGHPLVTYPPSRLKFRESELEISIRNILKKI